MCRFSANRPACRLPWLLLLLVPFARTYCQPAVTGLDPFPLTAPVLDIFIPASVENGYLTRAWVRDSLPPRSDSLDDLDRLDMIYAKAFTQSGGVVGDALFAALIASFEHRTIPMKAGINIPLTLEPVDLFAKRVARLPDRLFADLPLGNDRDKLQHFFGSAWLVWTLDSRMIPDLIGKSVESGEELLIRGGANDPRDVRANRLGQLFAILLACHSDALPSMIFRSWNDEYLRRFKN